MARPQSAENERKKFKVRMGRELGKNSSGDHYFKKRGAILMKHRFAVVLRALVLIFDFFVYFYRLLRRQFRGRSISKWSGDVRGVDRAEKFWAWRLYRHLGLSIVLPTKRASEKKKRKKEKKRKRRKGKGKEEKKKEGKKKN